jgi:hypothetical protein
MGFRRWGKGERRRTEASVGVSRLEEVRDVEMGGDRGMEVEVVCASGIGAGVVFVLVLADADADDVDAASIVKLHALVSVYNRIDVSTGTPVSVGARISVE